MLSIIQKTKFSVKCLKKEKYIYISIGLWGAGNQQL